MRILSGIAISIIASGMVFAADFSSKSNDELINMAGKVSASDAKDYFGEIEKRTDEMTVKEAKAFKEKLKAQEDKVFENMKVKDVKAYKKSIHENMKGKHGGMHGEAKKGKPMGNCGEGKMPPPPPKK